MWQALLPEPSAIVGSAPRDSKRSTVVNRSLSIAKCSAVRPLVGSRESTPTPSVRSRTCPSRWGRRMSRTTESLPQAAAPVRAAVRLAIIVSLSSLSLVSVAGRELPRPRLPRPGGGHVGLLAFLLACSVLRAALLLAGAVRGRALWFGQGCPATERPNSSQTVGRLGLRILPRFEVSAWDGSEDLSAAKNISLMSCSAAHLSASGRPLPDASRRDSTRSEAQRCRSTGAAAPWLLGAA